MSTTYPLKYKYEDGGWNLLIEEELLSNSSNPVANWVLKAAIGSGGGGGTWGSITGTITDQTDLVNYVASHGAGTWGSITGTVTDQTDLVTYINTLLDNYYTKSSVYTKTEVDALIPTVNDATLTIQKNGTTVDTFTANASANKTINITVPTSASDIGALPDTTKYGASISLTIDSSTYVVTATLKDQDGNTLGTAQTIDLPLESVVVSGSYDSTTKEVVLTLQDGSTIRFSVADLVAGLQTEITATNMLDADLVDDSTSTNQFVTAAEKATWNAKQDALTAGSNIAISNNVISATDTTYTAGTNVQIDANNVISATDTVYTLPTASTTVKGGVKVGDYLEMDDEAITVTNEVVLVGSSSTGTAPAIATDNIEDGAVTADKLDKSTIVDIIYPVGSIYMSVNNVSPATFLGGTWTQITDRFLLSAGSTYSAGNTGGSASTTLSTSNLPAHTHTYSKSATTTGSHTLTVSEIPSHSHGIPTWASGSGQNVADNQQNVGKNTGWISTASTGGGGGHTHSITLTSTNSGSTGSGTSFTNLPPYLVVYMWKRTA